MTEQQEIKVIGLFWLVLLLMGSFDTARRYVNRWQSNLHMVIPDPDAPSVYKKLVVHQDKDWRVTRIDIVDGYEGPSGIAISVDEIHAPCTYEGQVRIYKMDCAWLIAVHAAESSGMSATFR